MSISRSMPRRGWTLLTAILATIAVIAALLTVPWGKAGAAEQVDFDPNFTLGDSTDKNPLKKPATAEEEASYQLGVDTSWGLLVWAGEPQIPEGVEFEQANPNKANNVGWAWCTEPFKKTPFESTLLYNKDNAETLTVPDDYYDVVIGLARKMQTAVAQGDKKAAANYYVYLLMFIATSTDDKEMVEGTITGDDPYLYRPNNPVLKKAFPGFTGSHDDFTKITGYRIYGKADGYLNDKLRLEKEAPGQIQSQPQGAYITVVKPTGRENSEKGSQTVMPVDQPGLPPEPYISTNADFENGSKEVVGGAKIIDTVDYHNLVPGKEYSLDAQLISKDDGETVLGETKGHTFKPEAADGTEAVTITVSDDVKEPVKAAVAYEKLTSTVVNGKGEDTPDNDKPNKIGEHKDINDEDQTVPKSTVTPTNEPGKSTEQTNEPGKSTEQTNEPTKTPEPGKPSGTPDGSNDDDDDDNGSSKSDWPWWLLLIPGLGIVKIIADGFAGGHDGGHNVSDGDHDGGNDRGDVTEDNGRDNNVKDETVENGGRGDRDNSALDATAPEDAGQPLPSNAERVEIKHVPSGATKLEPGMQSYIK